MDLKDLVDKMKANLKSLIHSNSIHNIFNNEINNKFSKIGYKNKIIAIMIVYLITIIQIITIYKILLKT